MTTAIHFENVSKRFMLQHERPRSFQEVFVHRFRRASKSEFWALRNVSFEVKQGETVGLIGANGSGKSTVLKLTSRIIEPTSGRITVSGRLSALLELGAGFHPDLTGRENIYLNGSILGLSRRDMARKFDDIVAFADLGQFIDMPVRSYSSGMHMRLGFSVAIHVDPEILLVDEVLAVGDQAFQAKCFRKIEELQREGVTIVLVSHDLDEVNRLCDWVMWLANGELKALGPSVEVTARYRAQAGEARPVAVSPAVGV